jgi:hypothetical protein
MSEKTVLVAVRPALDPGEPRRVVMTADATIAQALEAAQQPGGAADARLIAALEEELRLSHQVWQILGDGAERPVTMEQPLSSLAEPCELQDESGTPVRALTAAFVVQAYLPVG